VPKVKESEEKPVIDLMKGDYFVLGDLDDCQYHEICKAMMEAGCNQGEYPFKGGGREYKYLQWWENGSKIVHGALRLKRLLSYEDVFSSSPGEPSDPITTLLAARKARDEAEQAYQAALEVVRNELPGYVLTEVGNDAPQVDGEDMTDPANWRAGDVVECVEPGCDLTVGKLYTVKKVLSSTDIRLVCDDNDDYPIRMPQKFRFHHRPA